MKRYIWGFPGVGKSSVHLSDITVLDADSNCFAFHGVAPEALHRDTAGFSYERNLEYPQNYLSYIKAAEADIVLLNCHISLLSKLDKDQILIVYPNLDLLPEYLRRYEERGDTSFVSHMAHEAEGMIRYIESSGYDLYRIDSANTYLSDLFERNDFKMKVITRQELTQQLQRAMDLGVIRDELHTDSPSKLIFDAGFALEEPPRGLKNAGAWAEAVLDGKYEMDIDSLYRACDRREAELAKEQAQLKARGGLTREELADKIMQGIVNGALGISYGQIAPYSHGYEVTFGGSGPVGSTRDFQNRWECYCSFFDIPGKIVDAIEGGRQNGSVFGADVKPLDIGTLLNAIDEMEGKKLQSFVLEKDTDFQIAKNSYTYPFRSSVATVKDVHAGKGLDGIVQHHYHGDYSSMTPSKYNSLVEMLVCMKGFCLDCLGTLSVGPDEKQKILKYLQKQGIDVSTPEKLRSWILENPQKCALPDNREMAKRVAEDLRIEKAFDEAKANRFGLSRETYDILHRNGMADADISFAVADWGVDVLERGYDLFTCSGSEVVVEGAVVVEMIGDLMRFESDFEACRQAEKDGYKFINDIDGLEKGCYVDMPENRALCEKAIQEHPEYRVENWLDVESDYGKKYVELFGPVASTKNWKLPLAAHGMDIFRKSCDMLSDLSQQGALDGTSALEDKIKTLQDAAGWMLATYEDTALEVIGDWIHDFANGTCWDFSLKDIQLELEKCFGFERDFPSYEEIKRDHNELLEIIKDVKTIEQAKEIAEKHGLIVEINGLPIDEFENGLKTIHGRTDLHGTDTDIEWIRYEYYGCLSYVYDRSDGKPVFDIYCKDGSMFVDSCRMEDLTEEKYEEIVDGIRDDFLKAKAQEKANTRGQAEQLADSSHAGKKPALDSRITAAQNNMNHDSDLHSPKKEAER